MSKEDEMVLDDEMTARWAELWELGDAIDIMRCRQEEKEKEFIALLREKFGITEEDNYEFVIHEDYVEVHRTMENKEEVEVEENNDSAEV